MKYSVIINDLWVSAIKCLIMNFILRLKELCVVNA